MQLDRPIIPGGAPRKMLWFFFNIINSSGVLILLPKGRWLPPRFWGIVFLPLAFSLMDLVASTGWKGLSRTPTPPPALEVMSTPGQPFVATCAENFSIDEKRKFYFVIFTGGNSTQPSISSEFPQLYTYSFCLHFGCICLGLPFFNEKRIF